MPGLVWTLMLFCCTAGTERVLRSLRVWYPRTTRAHVSHGRETKDRDAVFLFAPYDDRASGGVYCAKEPVTLDNDPSLPRIYDMAGNLIADASAYIEEANPTSPVTLQQWYNNGGFHRFTDIEMVRKVGVGYEGPAGSVDRGRKWYYAAVEIRSETWAARFGDACHVRACFFDDESAVVPPFHCCLCKHLLDGIRIAKCNFAILTPVGCSSRSSRQCRCSEQTSRKAGAQS